VQYNPMTGAQLAYFQQLDSSPSATRFRLLFLAVVAGNQYVIVGSYRSFRAATRRAKVLTASGPYEGSPFVIGIPDSTVTNGWLVCTE
jgi:hypothetical protein